MTSERAIPRLSGVFAIIWALFVMNPYGDVFGRVPSLYRPMLDLIPNQMIWGLLIAIAGIVCEAFTQRGEISKACFSVSIAFFAFAVLYLMSDSGSPAWALWGWIGVYNTAIAWDRRGEWKIFRKV